MHRPLDQRPCPEAVFVASDQTAAARCAAFDSARQDVAVPDFDDAPLAARSRPGLTTARRRVAELASQVTELLPQPPVHGESVVLDVCPAARASD